MKVFYETTGSSGIHAIYYAVPKARLFEFSHTTNVPLSELEIDEIAANRTVCQDLIATLGKVDSAGDPKYCVNDDGELQIKTGWTENDEL